MMSVSHSAKKGFGKLPKPFPIFYALTYLFFCGGGIFFNGVVVAGAAVPGADLLTCSIVFCVLASAPLLVVPLTETLTAMDNTISAMASIQVPFSKKSPVFCTPINCDELEKFDVKPPPLGFWINTIAPN